MMILQKIGIEMEQPHWPDITNFNTKQKFLCNSNQMQAAE